MIAGVLSTIALAIAVRLLLPESFFEFTMSMQAPGLLEYARLFAFAALFIGVSGAVTAALSLARWPGPVLGLGWLLAGAADGSGDWSMLRGGLLGVSLFAPIIAHALVLNYRFRRRLRKASMELELEGEREDA